MRQGLKNRIKFDPSNPPRMNNIKIDYLEFRDEKNLKLNNFKNKYRLFVAYNIDNVRLIDNY